MNSKLLFLSACIPSRLLLVFLAYYLKGIYQKIFGLILILIATSFFYLYFTNSRLNAPEAGGKTWWHKLRPIHGSFMLIAGILCLSGSKYAFIPLLIDVILGISVFYIHHYRNIDFI